MALDVGSRLGPYAESAKIGEGGMEEVCRALDTKLDRDAALKVLPEACPKVPTPQQSNSEAMGTGVVP